MLWQGAIGGGGGGRSKSAPHMHVLVYICSNVRQFRSAEHIIQLIFKLRCSLFGRVLSAKTSGLHTT